uniref:Uncharacterized protein n=1 Tax=Rhizophora mucronata TaxID=61149 RepID=A0A2P2NRY7_RHIMU
MKHISAKAYRVATL